MAGRSAGAYPRLAVVAGNVSALPVVDQIMKIAIVQVLIFFSVYCTVYGKVIHETVAIRIGNILQWIKVDGDNDQNPVLLFLHGGPGSSAISYSSRFTQVLQKHLIVVHWDQRETGKTKSMNPSPEPLTVSLFESDAVEVITYLKNKFHRDKIYLAGHSWGGFLALQVAAHHPELLIACFAAAPMVNQVESERLALSKMKTIASTENNSKAIEELSEVKIPFENARQIYFHRKWLHLLLHHEKSGVTQAFVENWASTWLDMFKKASEINLAENSPEINCAVYFLFGTTD